MLPFFILIKVNNSNVSRSCVKCSTMTVIKFGYMQGNLQFRQGQAEASARRLRTLDWNASDAQEKRLLSLSLQFPPRTSTHLANKDAFSCRLKTHWFCNRCYCTKYGNGFGFNWTKGFLVAWVGCQVQQL